MGRRHQLDQWSAEFRWGKRAVFDNSLGVTANGSVTLDGTQTVGHIQFNNSPVSYTISQGTGNGTLTINNSGANSTGVPSIDVLAGSHTICCPDLLGGRRGHYHHGRSVWLDPGWLTLSNARSRVPGNWTKLGVGTLRLSGSAASYSGQTNVQSGVLLLGTSSGANVGSLPSATTVTLGTGSGLRDIPTRRRRQSRQSNARRRDRLGHGRSESGGGRQ